MNWIQRWLLKRMVRQACTAHYPYPQMHELMRCLWDEVRDVFPEDNAVTTQGFLEGYLDKLAKEDIAACQVSLARQAPQLRTTNG
jgi:hypothetical protein